VRRPDRCGRWMVGKPRAGHYGVGDVRELPRTDVK
jgi:hypothetical protein